MGDTSMGNVSMGDTSMGDVIRYSPTSEITKLDQLVENLHLTCLVDNKLN